MRSGALDQREGRSLRRLGVLVATLALSACAGDRLNKTAQPLDGLLAFTKPSTCERGPVLDALAHSMLRDTTVSPPRAGPPVVPPRFRQAIGALKVTRVEGGWDATLPLRGTWFGLPVSAFSVRGYDGGDGGGFSIVFADKPARVRAALDKAGFGLPPAGVRPKADGVSVSLIGTTLQCRFYD